MKNFLIIIFFLNFAPQFLYANQITFINHFSNNKSYANSNFTFDFGINPEKNDLSHATKVRVKRGEINPPIKPVKPGPGGGIKKPPLVTNYQTTLVYGALVKHSIDPDLVGKVGDITNGGNVQKKVNDNLFNWRTIHDKNVGADAKTIYRKPVNTIVQRTTHDLMHELDYTIKNSLGITKVTSEEIWNEIQRKVDVGELKYTEFERQNGKNIVKDRMLTHPNGKIIEFETPELYRTTTYQKTPLRPENPDVIKTNDKNLNKKGEFYKMTERETKIQFKISGITRNNGPVMPEIHFDMSEVNKVYDENQISQGKESPSAIIKVECGNKKRRAIGGGSCSVKYTKKISNDFDTESNINRGKTKGSFEEAQNLKTELIKGKIVNQLENGKLKNVQIGKRTLKNSLKTGLKYTKSLIKRGGSKIYSGFKKAHSFTSKLGNAFLIRNLATGIRNGDLQSIGITAGMIGIGKIGNVLISKGKLIKDSGKALNKIIPNSKMGFDLLKKGKIMQNIGKTIGAGLSIVGIGFDAFSLYNNVNCYKNKAKNDEICAKEKEDDLKEFENLSKLNGTELATVGPKEIKCVDQNQICDGRNAIVDIVGDVSSIVLSTVGLACPPCLPVTATLDILIKFGIEIFQAFQKVDRFDKFIKLSGSEKFVETLRNIFRLGFSAYLKELEERKKANNEWAKKWAKFLQQNQWASRVVIPSLNVRGENEKCDWTTLDHIVTALIPFTAVKYADESTKTCTYENYVSFISEDNSVDLNPGSCYSEGSCNVVRWSPDTPVYNFPIFCQPKTSESTDVSSTSSNYCQDAIGIENPNQRGKYTFINLQEGSDTAFGMKDEPNIFNIEKGHKIFHGGSKDDFFYLESSEISGTLDGKSGFDILELVTTSEIHANFKDGELKFKNSGEMVKIQNMEGFIGKEDNREEITANCGIKEIKSNGGKSEYSPDYIRVPFDKYCDYELSIHVSHFTHIKLESLGKFDIVLDKRGKINIFLNVDIGNSKNENAFNFMLDSTAAEYKNVLISDHGKKLKFSINHDSNYFAFHSLYDNLFQIVQMVTTDGAQIVNENGTPKFLFIISPKNSNNEKSFIGNYYHSNIFLLTGGNLKKIEGGNKFDKFIFEQSNSNFWIQVDQYINGGGSDNSLIFEDTFLPNQRIEMDFYKYENSLKFPGSRQIKIKNFNFISGRKFSQEEVILGCKTNFVNLQGGANQEIPDFIFIPDSLNINCNFDSQIVIYENQIIAVASSNENDHFNYRLTDNYKDSYDVDYKIYCLLDPETNFENKSCNIDSHRIELPFELNILKRISVIEETVKNSSQFYIQIETLDGWKSRFSFIQKKPSEFNIPNLSASLQKHFFNLINLEVTNEASSEEVETPWGNDTNSNSTDQFEEFDLDIEYENFLQLFTSENVALNFGKFGDISASKRIGTCKPDFKSIIKTHQRELVRLKISGFIIILNCNNVQKLIIIGGDEQYDNLQNAFEYETHLVGNEGLENSFQIHPSDYKTYIYAHWDELIRNIVDLSGFYDKDSTERITDFPDIQLNGNDLVITIKSNDSEDQLVILKDGVDDYSSFEVILRYTPLRIRQKNIENDTRIKWELFQPMVSFAEDKTMVLVSYEDFERNPDLYVEKAIQPQKQNWADEDLEEDEYEDDYAELRSKRDLSSSHNELNSAMDLNMNNIVFRTNDDILVTNTLLESYRYSQNFKDEDSQVMEHDKMRMKPFFLIILEGYSKMTLNANPNSSEENSPFSFTIHIDSNLSNSITINREMMEDLQDFEKARMKMWVLTFLTSPLFLFLAIIFIFLVVFSIYLFCPCFCCIGSKESEEIQELFKEKSEPNYENIEQNFLDTNFRKLNPQKMNLLGFDEKGKDFKNSKVKNRVGNLAQLIRDLKKHKLFQKKRRLNK